MLRRRRTTIRDGSWEVSEGRRGGRAIVTRFDTAVAGSAIRGTHGIQIGVAVPLDDPDSRGMPRGDELEQLAAIEDLVVTTAGDRAVLVGVITTASMREFVLYTPVSEWIPSFHETLQSEVDHHEIQVMAQTDPGWSVYGTFVK